METLDYYSIADALNGMKDLVHQFPSGALIVGGGYNAFDEKLNTTKYQHRDASFSNRVQKARQQGLYPAILDYPSRFALYAYNLDPFILYTWDENTESFIRSRETGE